MRRTRYAALAGTCVALLALSGCADGATPEEPAEPAVTATDDVATSQDEAVVPEDQGGQVAPNSQSSPEAAQAYLECLTDEGVEAMIVDETQVVLVAVSDSGSVASSDDTSQAEEKCHELVPEYVEPDFNER